MRLLLFLITAVCVVLPVGAQATFHGNMGRTGAFDSVGPKVTPSVKWTFKTEGPIFSSPTIADGVVYIGSSDTTLYAVNQSAGTLKWKYKTNAPVTSSATIARGLVYFTSFDGILHAVVAETGLPKWRFSIEGEERRFEAKGLHGTTPAGQVIPDNWDVFLSSPAVMNDRVYFGAGDGNVYAVDAQTGVLIWKFSTGNVVHASPAVANGIVVIGSWDSYLYGLDADTGVEKWRFKTGEDPVTNNQVGFQASPVIVDGVVYTGCRDAHVYAVDLVTGRKKWDYYTKKSWVIGTPAVRDGAVYAGTSDSHLFHGLDAKSGRPRFTVDLKAPLYSSPALSGGLAYVGSFNGRLYAIDTISGKISWEFQTESSRLDPLKVLNPDGTFKRESYARFFYDFQDMYVGMFRRFSVGAILSSPTVDQGEIYFGATDGLLYALR